MDGSRGANEDDSVAGGGNAGQALQYNPYKHYE